ncbi:MAG: discoidin domain-containing protein [Myxococcales bacterium]|nr:discoidin domain-containing protein [Myxococcales bacterium]MCB9735297.1 discoidin domain-containing protein [Deltaproteobacteria bacterium]
MSKPSAASLLAALAALVVTAPDALAGPGASPDALPVARVVASSTRSGSPTSLADGDLATSWSPGGRSPRFAWIRFDLAAPSRVDGLVIANGVEGGDEAAALGRVRTAWVLFDDGQAEVIRLDPSRRDPRRVFLARAHATRSVTMVIRQVELGERWNHVALSEVAITGQRGSADDLAAAPGAQLSAVTPCGGAGWLPLRDAIVKLCGDPAGKVSCEDPVLDTVVSCRADAERPLPMLDLSAPGKSGAVSWGYEGRFFKLDVGLKDAGGAWQVTSLGFEAR